MAEVAIQVSAQLNDMIRTFRRVDVSSGSVPQVLVTVTLTVRLRRWLWQQHPVSVSDPKVGLQVVGQIDRVNLALASPCGIIIESVFHQQYDMADKRDCDYGYIGTTNPTLMASSIFMEHKAQEEMSLWLRSCREWCEMELRLQTQTSKFMCELQTPVSRGSLVNGVTSVD